MKKNYLIQIARIIILASMVFQPNPVLSQPKQKGYMGMDYTKWLLFIPGNDELEPFYISAKPVTNREYILYLSWAQNTYFSYPYVIMEILPGVNETIRQRGNLRPFADSVSFSFYVENSEPFVADYMFNPKYIDYPVIGVNWEQANRFCHWLSDRYNEYCLLKMKYMLEDPNQRDENNFSTESFIFSQYTGVWGKIGIDEFFSQSDKTGFGYVNYLLRPSFHIATRAELEITTSMQLPTVTKGLYNKFDRYTTDGSEYLNPFFKYYLEDVKGLIYSSSLNYEQTQFPIATGSVKEFSFPDTFNEWCLDSYLQNSREIVVEIFKEYGFESKIFSDQFSLINDERAPRKDYLGVYPYLITGENDKGEIELVKASTELSGGNMREHPYVYDTKTGVLNAAGNMFTTFRFSVNAIRKPLKN